MFYGLDFLGSVVVAAIISFGVMMMFARLISTIFGDIFQDKFRINSAFIRYVKYATFLVGVSKGATAYPSGYNIWAYRDTIEEMAPNLDFMRVAWLSATYATIIEALRALAYMYLALFLITLIAYVIVTTREKSNSSD